MKKAILIVAALVLVLSGVAAVSAYEAHTVNVKAHVENALVVSPQEVDFGTVFPEEWLWEKVNIELSASAIAEKGTAQGDLKEVKYLIYAEWKPIPAGTTPYPIPYVVGTDGDYYAWLGNCLYVGLNISDVPTAATMTLVGNPPAACPGAVAVAGFGGTLDGNVKDILTIAIDTPVFIGSYNKITDNLANNPKPSGLLDPTYKIPEAGDAGWFMPANYILSSVCDLGLDIKIQVDDIVRVP